MDSSLHTACITPTNLGPLDCNRQRFLDWRWRLAANINCGFCDRNAAPPGDQWLREAIDFLKVLPHASGSTGPTAAQQAIFAAHQFNFCDTLLRAVVEGNLLAQRTPQEIAAEWAMSSSGLAAFATLFFDVGSTEGRYAWSYSTMLGDRRSEGLQRNLGNALRTYAYHHDARAFDRAMDVVLGLTGPTLADGLSKQELAVRLDLAKVMLPLSRRGLELGRKLGEAFEESMARQELTEQAYATILEALSAVKLPKKLLKEIAGLRKRRSLPSTPPSAPADSQRPDGQPGGTSRKTRQPRRTKPIKEASNNGQNQKAIHKYA